MAEKMAVRGDLDKIVKIKMTQGGYDQYVGKMREGGVYEFPLEQAERYCRAGIARPAPASAKTAREEDRADKLRYARDEAEDYALDQEMSAAWAIDVRDLDRARFEEEAAHEAVEAAEEARKASEKARKVAEKAPTSSEPGPVHTQGPR